MTPHQQRYADLLERFAAMSDEERTDTVYDALDEAGKALTAAELSAARAGGDARTVVIGGMHFVANPGPTFGEPGYTGDIDELLEYPCQCDYCRDWHEPDPCPHCGVDLTGELIPNGTREHYGKSTHWSRKIGLIPDRWVDRVTEWQCPDCGKTWPVERVRP